jgi:hypothetical protein
VPNKTTHSSGEKLSMFVLAACVLAAVVGTAFATGFVIGKILL